MSILIRAYDQTVDIIDQGLQDWLPGVLARFAFAAVLLMYFFNSAMTKISPGPLGFLDVTDNAYFQILPTVVERYGFDASQVPLFPYGVIVYAGTWGELILPGLIVVGLLTRIAALGMIVFISVQSYVDIVFHHADEQAIGAWFDRFPGAVILDQRALWIALLLYLVIYGPGTISLDRLLRRR